MSQEDMITQKIREDQSAKGQGKFMAHHNKGKAKGLPSLVFAPW